MNIDEIDFEEEFAEEVEAVTITAKLAAIALNTFYSELRKQGFSDDIIFMLLQNYKTNS